MMTLVKLDLFIDRGLKQLDIGSYRRRKNSPSCSKSLASTKSEAVYFASAASFAVKSNQKDDLSNIMPFRRLEAPTKMRLT